MDFIEYKTGDENLGTLITKWIHSVIRKNSRYIEKSEIVSALNNESSDKINMDRIRDLIENKFIKGTLGLTEKQLGFKELFEIVTNNKRPDDEFSEFLKEKYPKNVCGKEKFEKNLNFAKELLESDPVTIGSNIHTNITNYNSFNGLAQDVESIEKKTPTKKQFNGSEEIKLWMKHATNNLKFPDDINAKNLSELKNICRDKFTGYCEKTLGIDGKKAVENLDKSQAEAIKSALEDKNYALMLQAMMNKSCVPGNFIKKAIVSFTPNRWFGQRYWDWRTDTKTETVKIINKILAPDPKTAESFAKLAEKVEKSKSLYSNLHSEKNIHGQSGNIAK